MDVLSFKDECELWIEYFTLDNIHDFDRIFFLQ